MTTESFVRSLIAIAAFLVLVPLCCFGQFETSAVLGAVRDPSGAVIVGTQVKLENQRTGIVQSAITDNQGDYQFLDVRAGFYRLTAQSPGFKVATAGPFEVTVNARQRVDRCLR